MYNLFFHYIHDLPVWTYLEGQYTKDEEDGYSMAC